MVNNSIVNLPYQNNHVVAMQHLDGVQIMHVKHNIEINCILDETKQPVCHLRLDASYHGKIAGVMGSFDGEKYNDHLHADGSILKQEAVKDITSWAVSSENTCDPLSGNTITPVTRTSECVSKSSNRLNIKILK